MKQKRILLPTDGPESWKRLLTEPDKHWRSGYSAMSLAKSWERAGGLPIEIRALFKSADYAELRDASLALAVPEYMVSLSGGTRPSQNDVFALLTCAGGLISMMIEGKAREDFDVILGEWKKRTSSQGARLRLAEIQENLGYGKTIPDEIKYQLLHRAASAVIEAKRFHAPFAAIVVQSFIRDDTENHYDDFCRFIRMYGKNPSKNSLIEISQPQGRRLYAGWVQSRAS